MCCVTSEGSGKYADFTRVRIAQLSFYCTRYLFITNVSNMPFTVRVERAERSSPNNYYWVMSVKIDSINSITRINCQLFPLTEITQTFKVYHGGA